MLKLTYHRKKDEFASVTVLGSPEGIRDLYWQLTANYATETDGTGIGCIKITNLEGDAIDIKELMVTPHAWSTRLDHNI